jgi:NADP-dependent aldehyde dehydrogenase
MDAAAGRPEPVPVFAEMSSLNPVFLLPGALRERAQQIAEGLKNSLTMGVGQFCTKPGLTFALSGEATEVLKAALATALKASAPGTLLHPGIRDAYAESVGKVQTTAGVAVLAQSEQEADPAHTQARPTVFTTNAETFRANPLLSAEIFGPAGLLVEANDFAELLDLARGLEGQLTATIHTADSDLTHVEELVGILERKAGRLLLNGFPTGIEHLIYGLLLQRGG